MAEVVEKVVEKTVESPAVVEKPAAVATVVTEKPVEKPVESKQFAWGDGWRDHIAGGDEKAKKQLERFADPGAVFQSFRSLQQKLSSGELKSNTPFPDKGTDEEKTAWRRDAGIPEKPEAYDLKFDDGFAVAEGDKTIVDAFLKAAHAKNLPQSAVKESVRWYFESQEARKQERQAADLKFKQESEDALRAEWGVDFRPNVNMVKALIGTAPDGVRDEIMHARLADGKPLTSHPEVLKWMVGMARTINPVTTVVPGSDSATMASSVDDEIGAIEKFMRTNRAEYNKDSKKQERLRELYGARERLKSQR